MALPRWAPYALIAAGGAIVFFGARSANASTRAEPSPAPSPALPLAKGDKAYIPLPPGQGAPDLGVPANASDLYVVVDVVGPDTFTGTVLGYSVADAGYPRGLRLEPARTTSGLTFARSAPRLVDRAA